jgi:hypothetical protein
MWFRDDVRNILFGVELANAHLAAHFADDQVDAYRAGYRAAIVATAACFGILVRETDLNAAMLAIAVPRGTP